MSFILDALKKSEERRRQDQPGEGKRHVLALQGAHARRWPVWLALALLLPLALLTGWWLGSGPSRVVPASQEVTAAVETPRSTKPAAAGQNNPAAATPAQPSATARPPATAMADKPAQQPVTRQAQAEIPAPAVAGKPAQPVEPAPIPVREAPTASIRTYEPGEAIPQPAVSAADAPSASAELPSRAPEPETITDYVDLSRELRSRLPQLEVSLHFYSSDPARRMVRIDGLLLHEGESLTDDLVIEEITPEGTIMEFHGRRFRLGSPGE